ncbi:ubiquitin-specific protease [Trifolium repens]|nr:ubiquitin-specific protease [Trifolium repens]
MELQESITEIFEKFTWKIHNFSRLNADKMYSEPFVINGYPWRILLYPKGIKVDNYLSIYLEAMKTANMSEGWSRGVKFKLVVFNQLNTNMTITNESNHDFNAKEPDWGFASFMSLTKLHEKGFLEKDACIVGAEVFVSKSTLEKRVSQTVNLTTSFGSQAGQMKVEVPSLKPERRGPSLEPLLPVSSPICIEHTKENDAELVSAALGRVIYFLKTRKVKDMNEQACKDLQVLWDQLEKSQFDLTWLEPHVKYALGLKCYVEKAVEAENLKENMVVLELEMERLKVKSFAAEVNLDAERDLLKAKGYKERDLDSELGCGSWRP